MADYPNPDPYYSSEPEKGPETYEPNPEVGGYNSQGGDYGAQPPPVYDQGYNSQGGDYGAQPAYNQGGYDQGYNSQGGYDQGYNSQGGNASAYQPPYQGGYGEDPGYYSGGAPGDNPNVTVHVHEATNSPQGGYAGSTATGNSGGGILGGDPATDLMKTGGTLILCAFLLFFFGEMIVWLLFFSFLLATFLLWWDPVLAFCGIFVIPILSVVLFIVGIILIVAGAIKKN